MKFICEKAHLLAAITKTSWAVSSKSTLPVMEGLFIDAGESLSLTGYDLSTGIKVTVPAEISEPGKIVINARLFSDIIRLLPDEPITFATGENMFAVITCKNVRHEVICLSVNDYPDLPEIDEEFSVSVTQSDLKKMISQTIFAISGDESKPIHTGSLFDVNDDTLTVVSVDGFRLSYRSSKILNSEGGKSFSFVVPGSTLKEVEKFCSDSDEEITLSVGKKHIIFSISDATIISRILEGDFLNYKNAIPHGGSFKTRVNRRDFISAIERASILINERIKNPIRLNFEENSIKLSCVTPIGRSKDECALLAPADILEIGFNNRYLLDALRACPDEEVNLELNTHVAPIIITPIDSEEYLHLVLPVRLKAE